MSDSCLVNNNGNSHSTRCSSNSDRVNTQRDGLQGAGPTERGRLRGQWGEVQGSVTSGAPATDAEVVAKVYISVSVALQCWR